MPNDIINIANVLAERLGKDKPTSIADVNISTDAKKEMNYEIMYGLLYNRVEKFILENQGNGVVDDFRNELLNDFAPLLKNLISRE
jgi:hypothetical protein